MVKLASVLSRLNPEKILVIGDVLVDAYTVGKASRISPEAPVAIVNVESEYRLPGGAGNVVLNLLSLGANVSIIGRVGKDEPGEFFCKAMQLEDVDSGMIVVQNGFQTPVKNRIIAHQQQIVRIDHEKILPLDENLEQWIIDQLPICFQGVKVIAISDYGKGLLTPTLLSAIFKLAKQLNIPVITDPKGNEFSRYYGTSIIKPNLSEAYAAANLPHTSPLEQVAARVLEQTQAQMLMITRSEYGITLFDQNGRHDFSVNMKKTVKDVTGAGDTVLAMFSYGLANKLSYEENSHLCNLAAGIAIETLGCARVSLSDVAYRLFESNFKEKLFDDEHYFVLDEVLKRKSFNVLVIHEQKELNHSLYQEIKRLSLSVDMLLIYLKNIHVKDAFIEILAALNEVKAILTHSDQAENFLKQISPLNVYQYESLVEPL
ncbi:MAG: bifunctional ADP-heptose synthase [Parachlamydiaceae bacterium]|nr:bifunctional ADP-heptose synthase [Parachlamydiaceae bacterium]